MLVCGAAEVAAPPQALNGRGNFSGRPGIVTILLAFPVAFAGYKALTACLALKRNAESYTRADADKMSALPAQPADCPEKLPRPVKLTAIRALQLKAIPHTFCPGNLARLGHLTHSPAIHGVLILR
ncbi:MAG: hypothetical protein ACP5O7_12210 [Phycisphaerae bacterium]